MICNGDQRLLAAVSFFERVIFEKASKFKCQLYFFRVGFFFYFLGNLGLSNAH